MQACAEDEICSNSECPKLGQYQCPRCKKLYCSRDCQKKDWKKHKIMCSKDFGQVTPVALKDKPCGNKECPNEGHLRCSRCKSVGYCSSGCQKKDWKQHKLVCNQSEKSASNIASARKAYHLNVNQSRGQSHGVPNDEFSQML